jgi:hypothetical protein
MKAFRPEKKALEQIDKVREMPPVQCLKCGNLALICRCCLMDVQCPKCGSDEVVEMPLYVEHPDTPFLGWLAKQRGRQGGVGRFADAVAEGSRKPKGNPQSWAEYVLALGFTEDDPLIVAAFDAVDEYYATVILEREIN